MKKTILATMIAVFLIFEGSGCGMTKPVSAQEKIISVMKEKYGEEFEFEGCCSSRKNREVESECH